MRSGNGRHRRPRQAPAIVVAAGVTGSALALPLLGAGSASAADAATWDRVAECESGGQWSAHYGNGLYGGLQFTQVSWERHGGLAYAPSADLASRAQQIAVAEKALAAGDQQWATCAPIAGLTNDGVKPDVHPGPAVTPSESTDPLPESDRTGGLPTVDTPPEALAKPESPETPATPGTPSSTPSASATPGTGKHRGDADPEETLNKDKSLETGRHASPSDSPTGETSGAPTDTPTPDAADKNKAANPDSGNTKGTEGVEGNKPAEDISDAIGEYTVKPGDNLTVIAQRNELPGGWGALYDANRATVGLDPDLILPGQSLDLTIGQPDEAAAERG
ncbi:transglycosylase family protein [Streptomyces sp. P9(2023)]|uniref:transglycosylase family protein n=1 Tax=Streptomyces sp. P9(2023) TaxID=3064394 RepID=UPI0028F41314|nr:transglycosylase family protein [Streptomyces sp. P9(2023)]MDT9691151.1 transglycosylase family protein [Streptomyces sp. P9(2023)]